MCVIFHDSGRGYSTTELTAFEKKKVAPERMFIDEPFSKQNSFLIFLFLDGHTKEETSLRGELRSEWRCRSYL